MTNGTTSVSTGLFANFGAAVLTQLPRDLDRGSYKYWLGNKDRLKDALRRGLAPLDGLGFPASEISWVFDLEVDYTLSLGELKRLGNYDLFDDYNFKGLTLNRRANQTVRFHLIRFADQASLGLEEIEERLRAKSLRSAELLELLTFGAKFPDVQRHKDIVALGSKKPDSLDVITTAFLRNTYERVAVGGWRWIIVHNAETLIAAVPID